MHPIVRDLVYDVGMYDGDDTAFYLHQGYRVLGIDADPQLAEMASKRFENELRSGRLKVLNIGIAEQCGTREFWISDDCRIWNSFDRRIAARNGVRHHGVMIAARRFRDVLEEHGTPFYLKIDIEGSDGLCVRDLVGHPLPKFISVESECVGDDSYLSDAEAVATLRMLREAGYGKFKLISQVDFSAATDSVAVRFARRAVRSAAEGRLRALGLRRVASALTSESRLSRKCGYRFPPGSSGPWGDSANGSWLAFEEAEELCLRTRHRHFQNSAVARYSFWYDWHATY